MMIRSVHGKKPVILRSVRGAGNIAVIGDVRVGEASTLWYGAVLRGDLGSIRIGDGTNLQDNCVLHCGVGLSTVVGRQVIVGHGAILHSCTVEDGCLIGMGSTLLDGCVIGEGSIIGAGTLIPKGKVIPPRSLVMGVPGQVIRSVTDEEAAKILSDAELYVQLGHEELLPIDSDME